MESTGDIIASRQLYKVAFGSCLIHNNALVEWHLKRLKMLREKELQQK